MVVAADGLGGFTPDLMAAALRLSGSWMLFNKPYSNFPLRGLPMASNALSSGASVGEKRQKATELFAFLMAATMVSKDTRLPLGSGERKTRTVALPTRIAFDQAAPFEVLPSVGSPVSSICLALYSAASLGDSIVWSRFA